MPTTTARIKVEAVGNIYFDISNTNFSIITGVPSPTPTATPRRNSDTDSKLHARLVGRCRLPGRRRGPGRRQLTSQPTDASTPSGGRSADIAGADFTNPFEYNPVTNTWTTKAATFPDHKVNNMACGVLTVGGTDRRSIAWAALSLPGRRRPQLASSVTTP